MWHLAVSASRTLRSSQVRIAILLFLGLQTFWWTSRDFSSSTLVLRNTPRIFKQKVLHSTDLLFKPELYVSEDLELVPHPRVQDHVLHAHQHPLSTWRPRNQFSSSPITLSRSQTPVFALGSVLINPSRDLIDLTYRSLAQSSLKLWQWYIIDDGTTNTESLAVLQDLADSDPRVTVKTVKATESAGDAASILRQYMLDSGASFGAIANPYTMFEHTMLEKAAWALTSVATWSIVGHFEGGAGINTGVHSGNVNLEANSVPAAAAFRLSSITETGCKFDAKAGRVLLWGMWLCLADQGLWGGTIGEVGSWPSIASSEEGSALENPRTQYPSLTAESWPSVEIEKHVALEPMTWEPAFNNPLPHPTGKSIMIIQGWLLVGGSEMGMLEILRHFAERGYRVTMVLTRFKYPEGMALYSQVSQYTNDIHTLPAFLRMSDFPRYIKYLIDSRNVESVLMSNSQLIYEILPSLAEETPGVAWIDYLHNESFDGWKTDGFPSFALINQRYLTRSLTCSNYLRSWLIARGYPSERVGVAKLGINISRFDSTGEAERERIKEEVFKLPKSTLVLSSSARLDTQKRPLLVPDILAEVNRRLAARAAVGKPCGVTSAEMYMMGDGALKDALKERIKAVGMGSHVHMLGTVDEPETILRGSDAFLLPSATEGISLAIAEAMAMTIPIITSAAGGLPEQLGELGDGKAIGGRLITLTGNLTEEIQSYADAVEELACSGDSMHALGASAREQVVATFDQDMTLQAFPLEFEAAHRTRPYDIRRLSVPNPAAYSGLQNMAIEDRLYVDLAETHKQLSRVKLTGRAGEMQSRCPASTESWQTAVLNGTMCAGGKSPSSWLFKSAKEQCGAWCLFDLHSLKADVWRFNGKCFDYFLSDEPGAQQCSEWFANRPMISFVSQ